MKLLYMLALVVGLTTATSILTPDSVAEDHPRRKVRRPHKYTGSAIFSAAPIPKGAPADYKTSTGRAADMHDKKKLAKLPSSMIDSDDPSAPLQPFQRRDVLRKLRGVQSPLVANDFYECATSGNPPKVADCDVVIDNVFATNQALSVSSGACLLFEYGTCWGFFCSLCEQLSTTTDFIGNQLTTAETLCVSGGHAGTVVGEDEPQWEAGLIRQGGALPNYDVC
ncbi:hypothetical protein F5Y19DRAFT_473933 [Xylariaceae sp. FL1651]|nr:hypothetical protein F5Y19DRAFT_473933 [Xylariaceae sp. FL1651]